MVSIEAKGPFINGIDNQCPGTVVPRTNHGASQRITKQFSADAASLLMLV